MTTAGMSRWTMRGALVILPPGGGSARTIVFQFNPASLRRRLAPQLTGGDPQSVAGPIIYAGAPTETIELELELDAGDQDTSSSGGGSSAGIQPQLSAMELLMYPSTSQVNQKQQLQQAGTLEIGPYLAPTVVFVWGSHRVIPVKVTSYSATEEAFDGSLVPIRARMSVSMQVLSYSDISPSDPAYHLFMAYQSTKESQATGGYSNPSRELIGVVPSTL